MANYIHCKAIRARITEEIKERNNLGRGYPYELESIIKKETPREFVADSKYSAHNYFAIRKCENSRGKRQYYLDYILDCYNDAESSEYGSVKKLTKEDFEKFEPMFHDILGDYGDSRKNSLCIVDYCYSDKNLPPDYYAEYEYYDNAELNIGEIMAKYGLVIRAIPTVMKEVKETYYTPDYPEGRVEYLKEYGRNMLIIDVIPENGGKFMIEQEDSACSRVKFKPKFYDSIEDAISAFLEKQEKK